MSGWIKLHRKFLEWEWFNDADMVKLFIYLLLRANHQQSKWQGVDVDRGQLITGRQKLAKELNISERTIRTCLDRLVKTEILTIKATNKYSIVTICNYDSYQGWENESDQPKANERPTNDQQSTTNNNEKNNKKDISVIFESFRKEYPGTKRGIKTELERFLKSNKHETVELLLPALNREKEYKEALRKAGQFVPQWKNLQTWINQRCWEQEFPPLESSSIKHTKQQQIISGW